VSTTHESLTEAVPLHDKADNCNYFDTLCNDPARMLNKMHTYSQSAD
jgi:hypothetical protein